MFGMKRFFVNISLFNDPNRKRWRKLRNEYIEEHPYCEVCGYRSLNNDVHHIIPRHIDPSRILDKGNLMTLCKRYRCHLRFGHFGNYKYWNPDIRKLSLMGEIMKTAENEFKK
ncbi:MAG: HNH endonuclease signature motif containing protein [Synergistaceae bacterium]